MLASWVRVVLHQAHRCTVSIQLPSRAGAGSCCLTCCLLPPAHHVWRHQRCTPASKAQPPGRRHSSSSKQYFRDSVVLWDAEHLIPTSSQVLPQFAVAELTPAKCKANLVVLVVLRRTQKAAATWTATIQHCESMRHIHQSAGQHTSSNVNAVMSSIYLHI